MTLIITKSIGNNSHNLGYRAKNHTQKKDTANNGWRCGSMGYPTTFGRSKIRPPFSNVHRPSWRRQERLMVRGGRVAMLRNYFSNLQRSHTRKFIKFWFAQWNWFVAESEGAFATRPGGNSLCTSLSHGCLWREWKLSVRKPFCRGACPI